MPTLKQYVNDPGHYVVALVNRHPVTFQLTEEGEHRLMEEFGLTAGGRFERAELMDLIKRGWAYTNHSGPGPIMVDDPIACVADAEDRHAVKLDRSIVLRLESTDLGKLDATIASLVKCLSGEQLTVEGPLPLPTRIERYFARSTSGTRVYSILTHKRLLFFYEPLPSAVQKVEIPPAVHLQMKERKIAVTVSGQAD